VSTNAPFYSLFANCRVHDLEPEAYLTEVIKWLPHKATAEQAADPAYRPTTLMD